MNFSSTPVVSIFHEVVEHRFSLELHLVFKRMKPVLCFDRRIKIDEKWKIAHHRDFFDFSKTVFAKQ